MLSLIPGSKLNLSSLQVEKLLAHAPGKVRVIAPFEVGDRIIYRVPGDPEEGPFQVIEISESHGQWWALVAKKGSHAWIHEVLVVKVDRKEGM